MTSSTLIICMLSTALVSTIATSGMWILAEHLRPVPMPLVLRVAPVPPASGALAMPAAYQETPADQAAADALLNPVAIRTIRPAATVPSAARPPAAAVVAGEAAVVVEPAAGTSSSSSSAPGSPSPAAADTPLVASGIRVVADPGSAADGVVPVSAPPAVTDAAVEANAAATPSLRNDDLVAVSADASPASASETSETSAAAEASELPQESAYQQTYLSYFGFDAVQVRTIPWYARHFHLDEDDLLAVCFIARAANVPFGPAISTYVQSCNGSFQELLAYYRLSPLVFLISPPADFRCPGELAAPYEWLRRGARETLILDNRAYRDLLALKLGTECLHCAPQELLLPGGHAVPLRLLRGHPVARVTMPAQLIRGGERADAIQWAAPRAVGGIAGSMHGTQIEPNGVIIGEDGAHRLQHRPPAFAAPEPVAPLAPQPKRSLVYAHPQPVPGH